MAPESRTVIDARYCIHAFFIIFPVRSTFHPARLQPGLLKCSVERHTRAVTMKVFIPYSEAIIEELGPSIGELVPFQLEYRCWRMNEAGRLEEQPIPVEDRAPMDARV
jgi:hypothetical protein